MASLRNNLLFCDLCNDIANRSEYLISNMWLMGDELIGGGEEIYGCVISFGYEPEVPGFDSRWSH
jgi:hypothetical protein